ERLIAIAKALGTEVKDLVKGNETNEPLEVVFRGELTNRQSKRAFEAVLFAIEDYVTMKQVD
ncbi:MAG: XRE family transcriptional regulator, partial [Caryophanon sp.]|nr:XRE family transcriptional regulator [Caryophanon sp.]